MLRVLPRFLGTGTLEEDVTAIERGTGTLLTGVGVDAGFDAGFLEVVESCVRADEAGFVLALGGRGQGERGEEEGG